jgi:ribonuclease HI
MSDSLEWRSVLNAVLSVEIRDTLPMLDQSGVVAYTDGACLKNPGGPAGWSALLWAAADSTNGSIREGAPCLERYGHIPKAETTTNNRAEISAILAVLSLAPPTLPLLIYSDSEYTIKVATGEYRMKANPDLWKIYRELAGFRTVPVKFEWVRGHAGHLHNERADELAGLGAFDNNRASYEQWQASNVPEAHNAAQSPELAAFSHRVERLQAVFATIAEDSPRASTTERSFIKDMAKQLRRNRFSPTPKQANWVQMLAKKHRVE